VYRFLLTPRWLGYLALTLVATTVMVLLGNWQLARYEQRDAINDRIDAALGQVPVSLPEVVPVPRGGAGRAGPAPAAEATWTRVMVSGRYDRDNQILVRGRTVAGRVGYEVLIPLVLADGTAVLVDRGWVPPAVSGASAQPRVPAVPQGEVTVTGQVRQPERMSGAVTRRDGRIETRRIAVADLATELPYPVYGAYLLLDVQDPPADPAFVAIPVRHENSWQNGGYVVQWWLFALMALVGFGWLVRREAHGGGGRPITDRAAAVAR